MTRLFGTNGIRGVIGPEMNADLAVKVGRAIGTFVSGGAVALARDPRLSGPMLARAAASGLMSAGCDVIDLGLVPTPCAQYFVAKSGQVKGAIVVTASHNPREFNGLKAIDSRGMEMRREDEEAIESIFFESRFHVAPWSEVGSIRADDAAIHRYTEGVLSKVDGDAIRKRAPSVVVDPGNGAGCVMTPYLLRSLGCRVLSLNAQPDGAFPGRLPEPTPDHLGDLIRVVREVHADIGIAHDGDADRATFVDDQGAFVVGDKSLALLARSAVKSRGGTVVTPVSTSTVVEDVVRAAGGTVVRTRVGSPIVARTMFETGAVFGGEENGGAISRTKVKPSRRSSRRCRNTTSRSRTSPCPWSGVRRSSHRSWNSPRAGRSTRRTGSRSWRKMGPSSSARRGRSRSSVSTPRPARPRGRMPWRTRAWPSSRRP